MKLRRLKYVKPRWRPPVPKPPVLGSRWRIDGRVRIVVGVWYESTGYKVRWRHIEGRNTYTTSLKTWRWSISRATQLDV